MHFHLPHAPVSRSMQDQDGKGCHRTECSCLIQAYRIILMQMAMQFHRVAVAAAPVPQHP